MTYEFRSILRKPARHALLIPVSQYPQVGCRIWNEGIVHAHKGLPLVTQVNRTLPRKDKVRALALVKKNNAPDIHYVHDLFCAKSTALCEAAWRGLG